MRSVVVVWVVFVGCAWVRGSEDGGADGDVWGELPPLTALLDGRKGLRALSALVGLKLEGPDSRDTPHSCQVEQLSCRLNGVVYEAVFPIYPSSWNSCFLGITLETTRDLDGERVVLIQEEFEFNTNITVNITTRKYCRTGRQKRVP